ncbi:MAG: hypothetical protein ACM3SW_01660 [Actinomycetota bacterium]
MSAEPELVIVGWTVTLLLARLIYGCVSSFSCRSFHDVYPFLLPVDQEALYGTFHPEAEEMFRENFTLPEFREVQWKRFHLAIHYCEMLGNNAGVFFGWTRYERRMNWQALDGESREILVALREKSIQCRTSAFVIRLRLRWWLLRMQLFPFLAVPTFRTLLGLGSADMISFYDEATSLAETFSMVYGEGYHQKLAHALQG